MQVKRCNKCESDKALEDFNKNKNKSDGLSSICKSCHKTYRKEHYQKNKEKVLSQVREYNKNNPEKIRKKSGRKYPSICRREGCSNTSYLTKKEAGVGKQRYCSVKCSSLANRVSPFRRQFYNIKKGAEVRNKEFNLSIEFLEKLIEDQDHKCAITNIPISVKHITEDTTLYDTASLDRIDSSKGYTEDNVQWVVLGINYMKLNFPEEDLHKTLKLIIKNYTCPNSMER